MSYSVAQRGTDSSARPLVEVSQDGATISDGRNSVKLSPDDWNLLIAKIHSGEVNSIGTEEDNNYVCQCIG